MKVKYLGDGTHQPCTVFGQTFEVDGWTEVTAEAVEAGAERLSGNPMFEVEFHPLDHDKDGRKGGSLPEPVEIPDDWREAHHSTKRALAERITGEKPASTDEAINTIEAELARRSAEEV